jgi:transcriptional regulator with XRE-family HTH domain
MGDTKKRPGTTDAAEILHRRYIEGKPEMEAMLDVERDNAAIARQVYRLRTEAKLTQQALAKLVGTSASVISRLEDADYEGHSLSMLRRIAAAVGKEVRISFVRMRGTTPSARYAIKPSPPNAIVKVRGKSAKKTTALT